MCEKVSDFEKRNINPGFAAILSFLFNGLGQLYNGEIRKGLWLIALSSAGIILTVIGAVFLIDYLFFGAVLLLELVWGLSLLLLGVVLIGCVGSYSIFDAYNTARRKLLQ